LVSSDYLEFLDYLLEQREYAKYPPYTFQAQILAESRNEQAVLEFLNQLYTKLAKVEQIQVSKPLPALHLKRNNTYRYSLLLTSNNRKQINSVVSWIRENVLSDVSSAIKVYFDIDPIELS
jgi:primosomal protein N' (replication factor Y) (superfamily II helicase)